MGILESTIIGANRAVISIRLTIRSTRLKPFGRFKSFITDFTDICNKKMAFDALLSYLM